MAGRVGVLRSVLLVPGESPSIQPHESLRVDLINASLNMTFTKDPASRLPTNKSTFKPLGKVAAVGNRTFMLLRGEFDSQFDSRPRRTRRAALQNQPRESQHHQHA
eukprot:SAG31_NODE_490_length_14932_cov_9.350300_9_plen_106_part_00